MVCCLFICFICASTCVAVVMVIVAAVVAIVAGVDRMNMAVPATQVVMVVEIRILTYDERNSLH